MKNLNVFFLSRMDFGVTCAYGFSPSKLDRAS